MPPRPVIISTAAMTTRHNYGQHRTAIAHHGGGQLMPLTQVGQSPRGEGARIELQYGIDTTRSRA